MIVLAVMGVLMDVYVLVAMMFVYHEVKRTYSKLAVFLLGVTYLTLCLRFYFTSGVLH